MSGWSDIVLADVKEEEKFPEVVAGEYTMTLLPGAKLRTNKFGTEELVVAAAISDGPSAGRWAFLQYPDPTSVNDKTGKKAEWSAQALKRLQGALGVDQEDGEAPVDMLNRVANNGHAKFKLTFGPAKNIRNGETEPRIIPQLFSCAPAA